MRLSLFLFLLVLHAEAVVAHATGGKGGHGAADHATQKPGRGSKQAFGLLGSFEFKVDHHHYAQSWRSVQRRVQREAAIYATCDRGLTRCAAGMRQWRHQLKKLKSEPVIAKLHGVNRLVNSLAKYTSDQASFGRLDYWASPSEFVRGRGDCEDFAIAKFFSLRELGFSKSQIRIAIVKDTQRYVLHAVVSVTTDDATYILDSLGDEVADQQYFMRYTPVQSFNETETWAHIVTDQIRLKFLFNVAKKKEKRQRVHPCQ